MLPALDPSQVPQFVIAAGDHSLHSFVEFDRCGVYTGCDAPQRRIQVFRGIEGRPGPIGRD